MSSTPLESTVFVRKLKDLLETRKSYRDHTWPKKLLAGELSRFQIRTWIEQHFWSISEVHEVLGPIYVSCPDPVARVAMIENLLEEETGRLSGSVAHRELMTQLIVALGGPPPTMQNIKPLPETIARRAFLRHTVRTRPFYYSMAAIGIVGESQFGEMAGAYAKAGEKHYGLSHEATAFWWVHAEADTEHGETAFNVVSKWARTAEDQQQILELVQQALEVTWNWFDSFAKATP